MYGSLQCPYYVHRALAVILGLPPEKVRVVQTETGGGFGGCTINLVVSEHAEAFRKRVTAEYEKAVGLTADVYITSAADGAARVA